MNIYLFNAIEGALIVTACVFLALTILAVGVDNWLKARRLMRLEKAGYLPRDYK